MSPLCQFLTLVEWLRQIEIIDSMQFVLRRVGQGRWHTEAQYRQRLGQALAQATRRAGVGVLQFPCPCFELGFGDDRGGLHGPLPRDPRQPSLREDSPAAWRHPITWCSAAPIPDRGYRDLRLT